MKRVARFIPALEQFLDLGVRGPGLDYGPFGRELRSPLEAPVGVHASDATSGSLGTQVFKEPPAHHLTDLALVICQQLSRDSSDDPRYPVLPLHIPVAGHLDPAAGQADDSHTPLHAR